MQQTEDFLLVMNEQIRDIRQRLISIHAHLVAALEAANSLSRDEPPAISELDELMIDKVRMLAIDLLCSYEESIMKALGEVCVTLDSSRVSLIQIEQNPVSDLPKSCLILVREAYLQLGQASFDLDVIMQIREPLNEAIRNL